MLTLILMLVTMTLMMMMMMMRLMIRLIERRGRMEERPAGGCAISPSNSQQPTSEKEKLEMGVGGYTFGVSQGEGLKFSKV